MNTRNTLLILSALALGACGDDDAASDAGGNADASADVANGTQPLVEGLAITLRNTLQNPGEEEVTYASLFGQMDDAFDESGTLSNSAVEFPTALAQGPASGAPFEISGLYAINFTESTIEFSVLPDAADMFWGDVFGLFPAEKVDRYYFTFSAPHNITGFNSSNSNLNVRIDSDTIVVVELSEGYDLQPGVSFSVNLL